MTLPSLPKAPRDGRWWRVADLDLEILCEDGRASLALQRRAREERTDRQRRKRSGTFRLAPQYVTVEQLRPGFFPPGSVRFADATQLELLTP